MHNWFQGKVRYEKINEAGMNVKVRGIPFPEDSCTLLEVRGLL